ncbi:hypothetical protein MtrunA17_Chr2g0311811 [Medicago truncatula]|uniref:Uncharacterized protein n=1 Tax=Medicago truncatula TaxID=3880 RepID=A0A396J8J1_MEDTR|nr:hypothetical protein MtrunA17_Chr2g0311811 [Medicago truncatula]
MELAKQIKIPASSIAREDAGADAEKVIKAAEEVQELVASEAGSLMNIAAGSSEATIPKGLKGILDSPHSDSVVVESDSTPSISTETTSSTFSSDLDDVPLGKIYTTIKKSLSPSTKIHKKAGVNYTTFEPMVPSPDERIGGLAQRRIDVCKHLPPNHPFQPPFIQPLNTLPAETNPETTSQYPTSTNQDPEPQKASEVASEEVTSESPQQQPTTNSQTTIPTSEQTVPEQVVSEQFAYE